MSEHDAAETMEPTGGDDELVQEGKPIKILRGPMRPTKLEYEEHQHSHIPFRSWCPHCMRGKSKASGHRMSTQVREKPILSLDYAFLGVSKGASREERLQLEAEAVDAGHTPTLVMFDSESRSIYAYAATRKGYNEHLCRQIVHDLDNLGYKEIVLKSDQEPAMMSLVEIVKANWNGDAALENSPIRESEANGAVERAIQTWEGQVRTLKDALEYRLRCTIPPDHPIMTWMVEYAASLIRRCLLTTEPRTRRSRDALQDDLLHFLAKRCGTSHHMADPRRLITYSRKAYF
jgi:thiol-disulfide isomerase/thioredoxin